MWVLAAAQLALACGAVRLGELDPPEGRQLIVDVSIWDNSALSDGAITAVLGTYSDNMSVTEDKPLLNRASLPSDARRIESFYAANGYFDARVRDYGVKVLDDPGLVRVHFRVDEGKPTRIYEVFYGDLLMVAPADPEERRLLTQVVDRLEKLSGLDVDDVWTEEAYELAKTEIRQALVQRGFLYAVVLGDVFVVREHRRASVHLHIAPGPLVRIGEVRVTGNRRVTEARIRRRIDLKPGQILKPSKLRETEEAIYALRAFYGVAAKPQRVSLDTKLAGQPASFDNIHRLDWEKVVDVEVAVQEMPIHTISTGVGTTIENTRNEFYTRGGYENRNFLGGLRYFSADARPKLVALPNVWERDARYALGAEADLRVIQPSFFEEYLEASGRTNYKLDVQYGYRSHKLLVEPALSRTFWSALTLRVAYNMQVLNYFDFTDALTLDLADTVGLEFRDTYRIFSLEQLIALDLRDVIYDPRNGIFASIRVNESFESIGSDFHYVRAAVDLRGYYSPWRYLTLASRLRYGQTFNALGADTPLPARFLGGGPTDVRGYGEGRMGPFLCQGSDGSSYAGTDDVPCDGSKVFVGGNVAMVGSFEARFQLPASFGLTAFVDAGEIWLTKEDIDPKDLNISAGPGLRYQTPFGPIRFDFAFLLTQPQLGRMTFHLSIGQAF